MLLATLRCLKGFVCLKTRKAYAFAAHAWREVTPAALPRNKAVTGCVENLVLGFRVQVSNLGDHIFLHIYIYKHIYI